MIKYGKRPKIENADIEARAWAQNFCEGFVGLHLFHDVTIGESQEGLVFWGGGGIIGNIWNKKGEWSEGLIEISAETPASSFKNMYKK